MFRLHYGQELQINSANRDGIHEIIISLKFLHGNNLEIPQT
jgi:hypothetical protein